MSTASLNSFLHHLSRQMAAEALASETDQQLVEKALAGRDDAVFRAIIQRHGVMVYRVCRRVLQHEQNAEDAFQATFLVLARKLGSVRKQTSLASWLHGVARRVALQARERITASRRHEETAAMEREAAAGETTTSDLREVLDEELERLPEKWRVPLILCYLEGRTQDEAARLLGWSKSTFRNRLGEARDALGRRLGRRGVTWAAALAAVLLSDCVAPAVPAPGLVTSTVLASACVAGGHAAGEAVSAEAAALTERMVKPMVLTKLNTTMAGLLVVGLLAVGAGVIPRGPDGVARAAQPGQPPAPKKAEPNQQPVDLTKIDRKIGKEPAYAGKPRYGLLVLGPKAEKRIWIVIDTKAQTLYVDRNGNGDLTEKGEQYGVAKLDVNEYIQFDTAAINCPDGNVRNLMVYQYFSRQFGRLVNTINVVDAVGGGQGNNAEDDGAFADSPKDAPIVHVGGALTLRAHSAWVEYDRGTGRKQKLVAEKGGLLDLPTELPDGAGGVEVPYLLKAGERVCELYVQVGTPGLGKGTFAALSVEKGMDPKLSPRADILTGHRTDANKFVQVDALLKKRCCGTLFSGQIEIPAEAAEGDGLITLTLPGVNAVAPAVVRLPLAGPVAGGVRQPGKE